MTLSIEINKMQHSAFVILRDVYERVIYAECHILALYAECCYAECHYVLCPYAEYRGALDVSYANISVITFQN